METKINASGNDGFIRIMKDGCVHITGPNTDHSAKGIEAFVDKYDMTAKRRMNVTYLLSILSVEITNAGADATAEMAEAMLCSALNFMGKSLLEE